MKSKYLLLIIPVLLISFSCKTVYSVKSENVSYHKVDKKQDVIKSPSLDSIIMPYKLKLDNIMNEVIGNCDGLSIEKPESTLGNWMADALEKNSEIYSGKEVSFAILNYGGIRIKDIPNGEVTLSKMYELMPFENYVSLIDMEGKTVKTLLDRIANYGGWPVSKSLRFKILINQATDIFIDGKPLDPESIYTVALPDYVANGGDDCYFLESLPKTNTEYLLRDLFINEVKTLKNADKNIGAALEGRITILKN
jgi:2',3'-cyclic-nucleotide 2'-phosphodiesterase (5'-nucleotidase family)